MSDISPLLAAGAGGGTAREIQARRVVETMRAECERRRRCEIAWLDEVERVLVDLSSRGPEGRLRETKAGSWHSRPQTKSFARKVREAVHDFGDSAFTLDDLASALAAQHPECEFTRTLLSRRLFDLRRDGEVGLAGAIDESFVRPRKQRKRLYRLMPPKSETPAAG